MESRHPLSVCSTLGNTSFPIALCMGDLQAAQGHLDALREQLERHGLIVWHSRADFLQGMLRAEQGETDGADALADALAQLQAAGFLLRRSFHLCALARGQALAGRRPQARATIEEALAWCDHTGERWYLPELLRLKAELVRATGSGVALREATSLCRQALDLAQRQGALAWELRLATSVAESFIDGGQPVQALDVLEPVLARFTEGFGTVDFQRASALASRLRIARAA